MQLIHTMAVFSAAFMSEAVPNACLESGEEEEDLELFTMPSVTSHKTNSISAAVPTLKDPFLQATQKRPNVMNVQPAAPTSLIDTLLPPVSKLPVSQESASIKETVSAAYLKAASGFCDMCYHVRAEYTCPACQLRTCSLACCQKHKTDFQCTGRKKPSEYIPVKDMDDAVLFKDLRFLEDVQRVLEAAEKDISGKRLPRRLLKKRKKNVN